MRKQHPPEAVNTYKVEVLFTDVHGKQHRATGEIDHHFGDGALKLAAEVLLWADSQIQPHIETPEEAKDRKP